MLTKKEQMLAALTAVRAGADRKDAARANGLSDTAVRLAITYAGATRGVYGLRCPLSNTIRYVGSSERIERRFLTHLSGSGTSGNRDAWCAWIGSLRAQGLKPVLDVLAVVPEPRPLWPVEDFWLQWHRDLGESDLNVHKKLGKVFRSRDRLIELEQRVASLEAEVMLLRAGRKNEE